LRVAFLLFAAYGALWLLLPRGLPRLPAHLKRAATVYLLAAVVLPLVGSPERMEEALFSVLVTCAVLATADEHRILGWALAVANALFVARIGGDARIPTLIAWGGLAFACGLAVWVYARPGFSSVTNRGTDRALGT
jgi:hypothetical protein